MGGWLLVYVVLTSMAGAGSAIAAAMIWRRRSVPGAGFLGKTMAGCAWWCACAVIEILASTTASTLFWARLSWLGVVAVSPTWLLFCLSYTGKMPLRLWRRVCLHAALAVIPVLTVVFVFFSSQVGFMWSLTSLPAGGFGRSLLLEHGPWFWVWLAFACMALLLGAGLLLFTVLRHVRVFAYQAVTLVAAILLPVPAELLYVLAYEPLMGLDITAPALVLSGGLVIFAVKRLDALEVSPAVVSVGRAALWRDMRDAVLIVDRRQRVMNANRASRVLFGIGEGELVGRPLHDLLGGMGLAESTQTEPGASEPRAVETVVKDANGQERWLDVLASRLGPGDGARGHVLVMRDISVRKQLERELEQRALRDEMTGLLSRGALRDELDRLVADSRPSSTSGPAILVIGFSAFRDINGTYGHEAGDELLRATAERLRASTTPADYVARLGGDHFAVVLDGLRASEAMRSAIRLQRRLAEPFCIGRQRIALPVSIGVAVCPLHGRQASLLLRRADVARFAARETRLGVALYAPAKDPHSPERLAMLEDLRVAVEQGDLALHFQPVVDLRTGQLVRAEALARWQAADGSMIPPAEFIPLAEQNGLLPAITTWVLRAAAQQSVDTGGARPLPVAVNLSPVDLRDPGLARRVERTLSRAGAPPECLWLEITETSVMSDPDRACAILTELREMGVRVSIDDFGVGHSSLAYLQRLPVSDVKIDRSFVGKVDTQVGDAAIVRATATLAHDLGLTVTAEGVETAAGQERVGELGCDFAQGYHIARPMPADDLVRWQGERQPMTAAPKDNTLVAI